MADFTVTYLGDLRTQMTHHRSGTKITTDAPVDNEGKGAFFSPTDTVAAALASCMITIMGIRAKALNFSLGGIKAEVTKYMADQPRRIGSIEIDLYFENPGFTPKQKQLLERITKSCPVSLSLHPEIKQNVKLHFKDQ